MTPADPLAAVTHADPYPYYRALAARQPFFRHEALGLWVAAGAAEVAAVLAHPDCRVRPPAHPVPPALAGTAAGELFGRLIRMNDGAAHAPLKAIVLRLLADIDPAVAQARAAGLADAMGAMPVDAAGVDRWMFTLPVVAVADLLGLPVAESGRAAEVASHVAAYAAAQSPLANAAEVQAGAAAAQWLGQWLRDAGPSSSGLLPALQCAAQEADIDPTVVAANAIGLMVQACEATAGLVGNTLVRLGREPALLARQDATALHALVARVARDDPPVQNTRRFLAADARLCGVLVSAGDAVLVLLAAASQDDTAASGERPWTFGAGRHACPGDALAQALAAATVAALLARGVRPVRLLQSLRYRPSLNARLPQFS